jgi:hypothetical protein
MIIALLLDGLKPDETRLLLRKRVSEAETSPRGRSVVGGLTRETRYVRRKRVSGTLDIT